MFSSDESKPKNAGERMSENFLRGGLVSEDEIERNEAASEKLEGVSRESAYLDDDASLVMHYWSQKDYVVGCGWDHLMPGDKSYDELCQKHGLKKPGDSNVIVMRFVDGEWVKQK